MTEQRLQKLISAAGVCSRRHAEKLLAEKRVMVNGRLAQVGDQADPEIDQVLIDGHPLPKKGLTRVVLLNKPPGFVSTCDDPFGRPTVLDLLPSDLRLGLHPIGRLDLGSRGALLLTNNGELTLRLTHPRYSHRKTYLVWVQGRPAKDALSKWREGVLLDGLRTMTAQVEVLRQDPKKSLLKIILTEGRNRQIRRVAMLLGHPVIDLQRIAISHLTLEQLSEGQWRLIPESEWSQFLNSQNFQPSDQSLSQSHIQA